MQYRSVMASLHIRKDIEGKHKCFVAEKKATVWQKFHRLTAERRFLCALKEVTDQDILVLIYI